MTSKCLILGQTIKIPFITFLFSALSLHLSKFCLFTSWLLWYQALCFAAGLWFFSLDLLCFTADLFKMWVLSYVCDESKEKIARQACRNLASIIIIISQFSSRFQRICLRCENRKKVLHICASHTFQCILPIHIFSWCICLLHSCVCVDLCGLLLRPQCTQTRTQWLAHCDRLTSSQHPSIYRKSSASATQTTFGKKD